MHHQAELGLGPFICARLRRYSKVRLRLLLRCTPGLSWLDSGRWGGSCRHHRSLGAVELKRIRGTFFAPVASGNARLVFGVSALGLRLRRRRKASARVAER